MSANTKNKLEHFYDIADEAKALGRSVEDHIKDLEAAIAYEKDRKSKFFAAKKELRNGYSSNLDLDDVDVEKVREDLGIPRGHAGTVFIKSEVRRLKQITRQKAA